MTRMYYWRLKYWEIVRNRGAKVALTCQVNVNAKILTTTKGINTMKHTYNN